MRAGSADPLVVGGGDHIARVEEFLNHRHPGAIPGGACGGRVTGRDVGLLRGCAHISEARGAVRPRHHHPSAARRAAGRSDHPPGDRDVTAIDCARVVQDPPRSRPGRRTPAVDADGNPEGSSGRRDCRDWRRADDRARLRLRQRFGRDVERVTRRYVSGRTRGRCSRHRDQNPQPRQHDHGHSDELPVRSNDVH